MKKFLVGSLMMAGCLLCMTATHATEIARLSPRVVVQRTVALRRELAAGPLQRLQLPQQQRVGVRRAAASGSIVTGSSFAVAASNRGRSSAAGVLVQEYNHHHYRISTHFIHQNVLGGSIGDDIVSKGPVTIGHDVWI